MKKVIILFFAWLLIVNTFGLLANNRLSLKPDTSYSWIMPEYTHQVQSWDLATTHNRWDSHWFLDIANNGYNFKGDNQLSNVVFFPLYPLLLSMIAIFGIVPAVSGWLVSVIFAFLAVVYLYKLVSEFHPESDPNQAAFLMLIFPTAIFLNSVYSESTFIFFSIASYYYALKKNYLLSGVFGFFAAFSRILGLALFIPILMEYFKADKHKFNFRKVVSLLLIPAGTIAFFTYHLLKFGNFLLYFKVQSFWGRGFHPDQNALAFISNPSISNFIFDIGFIIFGAIATIFIARKIKLSYAVYMMLTMLVPLSSGTPMSIGRYLLPLFPIYILGASIKDKTYSNLWVLISAILFGFYIVLFTAHYWAG